MKGGTDFRASERFSRGNFAAFDREALMNSVCAREKKREESSDGANLRDFRCGKRLSFVIYARTHTERERNLE